MNLNVFVKLNEFWEDENNSPKASITRKGVYESLIKRIVFRHLRDINSSLDEGVNIYLIEDREEPNTFSSRIFSTTQQNLDLIAAVINQLEVITISSINTIIETK